MSNAECSLTAIARRFEAKDPRGTALETTNATRSLKTSRHLRSRPSPAFDPIALAPARNNARYACLRQMFAARCSANRPAWTFSARIPFTTSHANTSTNRARWRTIAASCASTPAKVASKSAARTLAGRPSPAALASPTSLRTSGTTRRSSLCPRPIWRMRHAP